MDTETKFQDLRSKLEDSLEYTDISVSRDKNALAFWNDDEKVQVGLEITKPEVRALSEKYQNETWEQVSNRILRDAYHYLVLKYL